jgi:hypothetical protein
MNDLLIHWLGARRVHWRYDDPAGVADVDARTVRPAGRSAHGAEARLHVRRHATTKAA